MDEKSPAKYPVITLVLTFPPQQGNPMDPAASVKGWVWRCFCTLNHQRYGVICDEADPLAPVHFWDRRSVFVSLEKCNMIAETLCSTLCFFFSVLRLVLSCVQ